MKFTIEEYIKKVQNADFETLVKLRHPPLETFKEYESIGESEHDLIQGTWNERLDEFEPLSHEQKVALIPYDDIDDRLIPIIKRLNGLTFYTKFCCQGADFETDAEYDAYFRRHPNVTMYYPNGEVSDFGEYPNGSPHNKLAYIEFMDNKSNDLLDLIVNDSNKLSFNKQVNRVESTNMKFNSEFHIEFDRILDEWFEDLDC